MLITTSNNLLWKFCYNFLLLRSLLLMRICCIKWNWQQIVSICNIKHLDTYVGVCWFRTPAQWFGQTIFFVHWNSLPVIVIFINLLTASECCTQLNRCLVKTSLCESIFLPVDVVSNLSSISWPHMWDFLRLFDQKLFLLTKCENYW